MFYYNSTVPVPVAMNHLDWASDHLDNRDLLVRCCSRYASPSATCAFQAVEAPKKMDDEWVMNQSVRVRVRVSCCSTNLLFNLILDTDTDTYWLHSYTVTQLHWYILHSQLSTVDLHTEDVRPRLEWNVEIQWKCTTDFTQQYSEILASISPVVFRFFAASTSSLVVRPQNNGFNMLKNTPNPRTKRAQLATPVQRACAGQAGFTPKKQWVTNVTMWSSNSLPHFCERQGSTKMESSTYTSISSAVQSQYPTSLSLRRFVGCWLLAKVKQSQTSPDTDDDLAA